MTLVRPRQVAWTVASIATATAAAAWASPGRLGGGESPDVSIARIIAALVISIIVAILAVLLIRQRGGKIDLRNLVGRMEFGTRAIQVVETRRLSPHADICLIRYEGREYLLLLQAGDSRLLSEKPPRECPDAEGASPCA